VPFQRVQNVPNPIAGNVPAANPLQDHACVAFEGLKHLVLGPHTAVTLHFAVLGEEIGDVIGHFEDASMEIPRFGVKHPSIEAEFVAAHARLEPDQG
jgi:hypothetical protein